MKFQPKDYCYYSRVLKREFDTLEELRAAEAEELKKQEAKLQAAETKKNDAAVVETAYKNLNAAKKTFKADLAQVRARYAEDLKNLNAQFEEDQKAIAECLANAEKDYSDALKDFTEKYPEGYHITLKDGDFETTISSKGITNPNMKDINLFDLFFGF